MRLSNYKKTDLDYQDTSNNNFDNNSTAFDNKKTSEEISIENSPYYNKSNISNSANEYFPKAHLDNGVKKPKISPERYKQPVTNNAINYR